MKMNSGKVSFRTILALAIILLVGLFSVLGMNTVRTYMSGASAGAEPKGVLAKPNDDGKGAVISWSSDKPVSAVVEYGTTPASLLLRAIEPDATTGHRVSLSPLKPGVNYYFRIRVGDEVFDNNGIPFSFKTKSSDTAEVKVSPTIGQTVGLQAECSRTTDYNSDGVINTVDYLTCVKNNSSVSPVVTKAVTGQPAGSTTKNDCMTNVDYDGNGVVNSLDRIKCLQKR